MILLPLQFCQPHEALDWRVLAEADYILSPGALVVQQYRCLEGFLWAVGSLLLCRRPGLVESAKGQPPRFSGDHRHCVAHASRALNLDFEAVPKSCIPEEYHFVRIMLRPFLCQSASSHATAFAVL